MHSTGSSSLIPGISELIPGISGSQNCKHIKVHPNDTLLLLFSCQNPLLHVQDIWSPSLCCEPIEGKRKSSSGVLRLLLKLSSHRTLRGFSYWNLNPLCMCRSGPSDCADMHRTALGVAIHLDYNRKWCPLGAEQGDGPGYVIFTKYFSNEDLQISPIMPLMTIFVSPITLIALLRIFN